MGPTDSDVGAVLLTGVGKRYDIVSAFAQHTTVVAADPNPLAPAQYAAHHRSSVPRIEDPEYVPARPTLIARYYVLTTASLAAGLWDWLVHGTAAGWEPAEGTR